MDTGRLLVIERRRWRVEVERVTTAVSGLPLHASDEGVPLVTYAMAWPKGTLSREVVSNAILLWWGGLDGLKDLSLSPLLAGDRNLSKSIGLLLSLLCHVR